MCKNWIEQGMCRYGQKCQFAHGEHELLFKEPQNEKYKSKICKQFSEKLFCPYGNRCLFKHEDRSFEEVHSYHYVYKILILKCCYPIQLQESSKDSLLNKYLK